MEGVTFAVYKDGAFLGNYTTDPMGEILIADAEPGTYRVFEVDTGDDGHILDTTPQEIELKAGDGILKLVFFNDRLPGIHLITSFDCSGFVSWVINHSGWNVGRLGAQGLCNICTPVSPANVRPGDLVFFKGTYDTPGVSHCGIYVGNGMMIHCGNPISYANLNTSYWQNHFYCYGRLP